MSEEQLKRFLDAIKSDSNLKEKLKTVSDIGECCSVAKDAGFTIESEDINYAQSHLSEEELEGVAGGKQDCKRGDLRSLCNNNCNSC